MPDLQAFLRRNCTSWDHNGRQLQGLTSDVCSKYCCLFALYMDLSFTPQQFVAFLNTDGGAEWQVDGMFASEFGAEMPRSGCSSVAAAAYKI